MSIQMERIDHIVLTVRDIEATCRFYEEALGMKGVSFAGGRKALTFGDQKINLHKAGEEFEPKAANPTPGSADLCLIASVGLAEFMAHLKALGIKILEGPVLRMGAMGPLRSVYLRDPDGNLIEVGSYD